MSKDVKGKPVKDIHVLTYLFMHLYILQHTWNVPLLYLSTCKQFAQDREGQQIWDGMIMLFNIVERKSVSRFLMLIVSYGFGTRKALSTNLHKQRIRRQKSNCTSCFLKLNQFGLMYLPRLRGVRILLFRFGKSQNHT